LTPLANKRVKEQPQAQAPLRVHPQVGATIHQALVDLGGSNPAGGVQTILQALTGVAAPLERMPDLFALGQSRLEQQKELFTIPNPTGYLIGIMRNVAVEGMLKGWNVAQMRAEDEVKHAQALRSAARAEISGLTYEGDARPQESASPAAGGWTDVDPRAAPTPDVPEEVEVADAATVATWHDHLPDPEGGQPRSVSMLWGFVRGEISSGLPIVRRQHLTALTPKWDTARPRTLLLLCRLTYTARAVELTLRREIQPQLDTLLSRFFDTFQVVYAPEQEESV
jgi:hypothetical protein